MFMKIRHWRIIKALSQYLLWAWSSPSWWINWSWISPSYQCWWHPHGRDCLLQQKTGPVPWFLNVDKFGPNSWPHSPQHLRLLQPYGIVWEKFPFLKITILNFWNLVPTFLIIYDQTGWLLLYQKSQNNPPNDWPILSFITCSANAPSTPPSPASVPSPTDALHLISPLLLTLPLLLLLPLLVLSSFSCFTPLSSLPFLPPWHWRTRCSLHIIFFSESLFLSWEPFSLLDFYLFSHLYSWQKLPPFVNRIFPLQIFFWNKLGTNASLYRDSLHIAHWN